MRQRESGHKKAGQSGRRDNASEDGSARPGSARRSATRGRSSAQPEAPSFSSDEEEAAWIESEEGQGFLAEAAALEPVRFRPARPDLVPVTIRLPADLREGIRRLSERRGMGYQTLARQWLMERCEAEEQKG